MIGRFIGSTISSARDALAKHLIRLGVTPDMLTFAGMVLTGAAGVCYALGATRSFAWSFDASAPANAYLLLAGVLLIVASACDMLDGAVAKIGGKATRFGAFLDSTLDRYSDFAVYAGIALGYSWRAPANITFVLLSMLAFFGALMISYTRARAEDLIESCSVGYWQRGERSAAILIATFAYNTPALLVQQGISPLFTAIRRIGYTRSVLAGRTPVTDPRNGGWWLKVRLWRYPRMTVPYDIVTGLNIAWLIFARIEATDVIRNYMGG
ncbi:MAG: CDP-alcohol phosphatidyltransferase family protein [Planctomycetota bacterium]|jgi:CDP-diacylglycerol--glycerol-3-phosphate 3-phosphatidyltransferase